MHVCYSRIPKGEKALFPHTTNWIMTTQKHVRVWRLFVHMQAEQITSGVCSSFWLGNEEGFGPQMVAPIASVPAFVYWNKFGIVMYRPQKNGPLMLNVRKRVTPFFSFLSALLIPLFCSSSNRWDSLYEPDRRWQFCFTRNIQSWGPHGSSAISSFLTVFSTSRIIWIVKLKKLKLSERLNSILEMYPKYNWRINAFLFDPYFFFLT